MAFFEDLGKKTKAFAAVAADKAKDAAELTKINVAIAGEQREIDKTYRTIPSEEGLLRLATDGETVTIDVNHRDGTGKPPNVGNWMIDYHDNMTFVNRGDRARTVTINKHAQGALMAMVISPEGEVLATKCTIVPLEEPADQRQWSIYTAEIPPHSTVQFCVSFLLMGNSYGNVNHWITVV